MPDNVQQPSDFNVSVPVEELRKRSVFIATPMYGGMCHGTYTKSLADTMALFLMYGVKAQLHFLFNESLIQRARNYCVQAFLDSDCTHLMFIDSDIAWNANDILSMLALAGPDSDYDVIAGPYPKKCLSTEKMVQAVNKGLCDENPEELLKFVGDYVFNMAGGTTEMRLDRPAEVLETGTGFMMIKRETFEKFAKAYPHKSYRPDHIRSAGFDGSREILAYFDCEIDPDTKRYLSEDYLFCQRVRQMGGKVWLCPWIQLQHTGTFTFAGSLADIARVGASATADPSQLKHFKKGKK